MNTNETYFTFTSLAHNSTAPTTVPCASVYSFEEYAAACMARVLATPVCPPSGEGSDHETMRVAG